MDEIIKIFNQGKFQKCLGLIKSLPETSDTVSNLLNENNSLICESNVGIIQGDFDKINEIQEKLYIYFDRVTSLGVITPNIPLQLKLTATFNFIFWLLFYNDNNLTKFEQEEYLKLVNKGLQRGNKSLCLKEEEKIMDNLKSLRSLIPDRDSETGILIIELVTVTVLYMIKLNKSFAKKCSVMVGEFLRDLRKIISTTDSLTMFLGEKQAPLCLFKFGLDKTAPLAYNENKIDYLDILEAVLLHLQRDYKGSLKSLQKNVNCTIKSLWYYLGALNSFELENYSLCLGFLTKASSTVTHSKIKARCHVLSGKLCCVERNHKEALKHFGSALKLFPECSEIYYYVGQEYGKMGLFDLMLENFEKLVEMIKREESEELASSFETLLLSWIHPFNEISYVSALYCLAVSYGLNERFYNAAETFEKILQESPNSEEELKTEIIQMPHTLTILHDASIMHLLTGNLVRAEQLALDAIDSYIPVETAAGQSGKNSLPCKDVDWLQKIILHELLENDLESKELPDDVSYSEELLYCFSQNVIALFIMSEIQRIQELEDYKVTLSKILSVFSPYLSSMSQREVIGDEEKVASTLVKTLAGKTCVKIAEVLITLKDDSNVEKMYKRALSSNRGDKDALCNYYTFLKDKGKRREAFKLWRMFCKEEPSVFVDNVQSFALRYILKSKITKRDLEKIQAEVDLMTADFC